jgi:hypothetical protein
MQKIKAFLNYKIYPPIKNLIIRMLFNAILPENIIDKTVIMGGICESFDT